MVFKRKKSKKGSRMPKDPRKISTRTPNYRAVRDRMLRNAYIILIIGVLAAFLAPILQALTTSPSIDPTAINQIIMAPPSLLSIIILAISISLSVFLVVKAYTAYLYFRLVDALTRLTESAMPKQIQPQPAAPITPQLPQQVAPSRIQPQMSSQQVPGQRLPQIQTKPQTPSPQTMPIQGSTPITRETIQQPQLRPSTSHPSAAVPRQTQPTAPQQITPKPYTTPSMPPAKPQIEKKRCPYCGRELPFGDLHTVCPYCGRRLK